MEAPISIQAPHSRSHLFRAHSSYSNDIYGMRTTSRDNRDMLSQPPRHYPGQKASDSLDSNAPSSDRTHTDLARQQAGLSLPMAMHPAHSVPQQLNPPAPRSYDPPRQESRVSVNNLLDSAPNRGLRQSITMRDSPSHPSSAPMSPRNAQPTPAEGRLPGVSQVSLPRLCDSRSC